MKHTNIKAFIILLFLVCMHNGFAQQDAQFTQYMYNTTAVNPAYAGSREGLSINSIYRTQWVGLDGAPETIQGSIHSPIGNNIGLGLTFINDKIGPSQESLINADFSYTLELSYDVKLALGLKAGIQVLDVNFNDLIYDPSDPYAENINGRVSPTVGVGAYMYSDDRWYIGLSSPNLLMTEHYNNDVQNSEIVEEIHMYFIGGYVFDISENTKLKPAFLTKAVTGAPLAIDLSANFLFYEKFTLGAAYRFDAAVSALAGFQVTDELMIGYAYDLDTVGIGNYNSGSHEVFLRYDFNNKSGKITSPRFF